MFVFYFDHKLCTLIKICNQVTVLYFIFRFLTWVGMQEAGLIFQMFLRRYPIHFIFLIKTQKNFFIKLTFLVL